MFIKDQLSNIDGVEHKKMFGGIGFFKEGLMFAMIGYGKFRLKVDDTNKAEFEARGMKPFESTSKKKGMPYWEVPADILEDKDEITIWANRSIEIAKSAKK